MIFNFFGKEYVISYRQLLSVVAILFLTAFILYDIFGDVSGSDIQSVINSPDTGSRLPDDQNNNAADNKSSKNYINVYIFGEVKKPGVYKLKKGSLINDVITKAGGLTRKADSDINLAWSIKDNIMIKISDKKSSEKSYVSDKLVYSPKGKKSGNKPADRGKVNINKAGREELMTIPWVGESTAASIMEYRKETKFERIEDIMNVSGIGEGKFDKMKDVISVN